MKDSIVESLIDDFRERSRVGIEKYNTTLDRDYLSDSDWKQHLLEELMDACLYLKRIQKNENRNND
jgi:hypothetical protein